MWICQSLVYTFFMPIFLKNVDFYFLFMLMIWRTVFFYVLTPFIVRLILNHQLKCKLSWISSCSTFVNNLLNSWWLYSWLRMSFLHFMVKVEWNSSYDYFLPVRINLINICLMNGVSILLHRLHLYIFARKHIFYWHIHFQEQAHCLLSNFRYADIF